MRLGVERLGERLGEVPGWLVHFRVMAPLHYSWLLVALGVSACSSSSGSGSAIVGEWSTSNAGTVEEWFFNSNGTCGVLVAENKASVCTSSCTYTFDGTTLSLTTATTSGSGAGSTTTNDYTIAFTQGGSSATVTGACESSVCTSLTFTRVNSNDGNSCP